MSRLNDMFNSIITEQVNANKNQLMAEAERTACRILQEGYGFTYNGVSELDKNLLLISFQKTSGQIDVKMTVGYSDKTNGIEIHSYVFISTQQVYHALNNDGEIETIVQAAYDDLKAWLEQLKESLDEVV